MVEHTILWTARTFHMFALAKLIQMIVEFKFHVFHEKMPCADYSDVGRKLEKLTIRH